MPKVYEDTVHAESLFQKLWLLCKEEDQCDLILIAGTEEVRIPAHRSILCASSKYFCNIIRSTTLREVRVPDIDGEVLQLLVQYIYTGSLEIKIGNVEKIIEISDMLGLSPVVNACGHFLTKQLHPSNCIRFASLGKRYNFDTLIKLAHEYSKEYFMDVCKTDEFLSLDAKELAQLLARDDIAVLGEEDVFNSVIAWLEHDRSEREKHEGVFLKLVRTPLLDPSFFAENLKAGRRITNDCYSSKPRKPYEFLMGITESETNRRSAMCIRYYNQGNNKWIKWQRELEYRLGFDVAIIDDNLYIAGGFDAKGDFLNNVICVNLKTMNMKEISSMNEQRAVFGVVALRGSLYALGGWAGHYMNSVEKWDAKDNKWNLVSSMSVNRSNFGKAVLNDKLYVIGGVTAAKQKLQSAECYNADQNSWTSIAPMNECHTHLGVAVVNGLLYAVGGYKSKTVERYDPATNRWTVVCSLNENLICSQSCISYRNKIVVCYNDRVEEYNEKDNEWIVNSNIEGLTNIISMFPYSNKLLLSEFLE